MNVKLIRKTPLALLAGGFLAMAGMTGCQTQMAGMTLPSGYYLRDDVQFFPAGPEFLLPNTQRALDDYRAAQEAEAADYAGVP
ncbi:hypothetical protein [Planctomicrobium sp. SH664]|uniref:hypothetical protein n=1 Tax=Planctomicrobium sp. SH664 TaxID=3448125 RepID=UPI003F5B5065